MAQAAFWDVALSAVALMLVAEGLLPFVSPQSWRRIFERALQMSDGQIRFLGLVSMDQCLLDLVKRGLVTRPQAASYAKNKEIFK